MPPGPVDDLQAYAPFIDPAAHALRSLVERLAPGRITLGLQPRWSGYDAETVKAALAGPATQIRLLDETRMRHGKFIEWRIDDRRHALTGSPNLTGAALCTSTREGGNCELAVLSADTLPLLPEEGRTTALTSLSGRTIRPFDLHPSYARPARGQDGQRRPACLSGSQPAETRHDQHITRRITGLLDGDRQHPRRDVGLVLPGARSTRRGGEHDMPAARAWQEHKDMIARAEPAQAEDLMLPPEQALARVAPWSEVERLIALAQEDDPDAEVIEELSGAGWSVTYEDGIWEITGSFGNPVPVASRAADRLGRHHANGVLVRARSRNRWAFVAWTRPHLVLLNPPARVWRSYQVRPPATPESRFSGGDLSSVPGLTGAPTPLRVGPPEALREILAEVGLSYPELIRRLFEEAT